MIEITIKTLDSQNHVFSVEDDLTVKQLKEHIAEPVNVPVESQRLIYCGRVLLDDKKLTDYDVNGKVIHLVQRAPPGSSGSSGNSGEPRSSTTNQRRTWRGLSGRGDGGGNAMYLGAMAFPADLMDAQGITMPQARHGLSQSRLSVARLMLQRARATLQNLENPSSGEQTAQTDSQPQPSTPPDNIEEGGSAANDMPVVVEIPQGDGQAAVTLAAGTLAAGSLDNNYLRDIASRAVSLAMSNRNFDITQTNSSANAAQGDSSSREDRGSSEAPQGATSLGESFNNVVHEEEVTSENVEPSSRSSDPLNDPRSQPVVRIRRLHQTPGSGSSAGSGPQGSGRSRYPNTTVLADLMNQFKEVNQRLQPFMDQYINLMQNDPADVNSSEAQSVFNQVSEVMHLLSHAYHALSDIMCDFSQPPPRYLRCRPVLIQHSTVLQTGIPIQAQMINLSTQSQSGSSQQANAQNEEQQQEQPPSGEPAQTPIVAEVARESEPTATTPSSEPQAASQSRPSDQPTTTTSSTPSGDTTNTTNSGATGGTRPSTTFTPSRGGTATLNIGPSNFEIYMDVGAGSISFDSVEATVVTNGPSSNENNTSTSGSNSLPFPWGPPPTDFIQNLIQRLAGEIAGNNNNNNNVNNNNSGGATANVASAPTAAAAAGAATAAAATGGSAATSGEREAPGTNEEPDRSAAAPNLSSNSGQSRPAYRPHVHFAPSFGAQGVDFFDPFLPCNSHHIRRRRNNNGGSQQEGSSSSSSNTGASSNRASAPGDDAPSSEERPSSPPSQPTIRTPRITRVYSAHPSLQAGVEHVVHTMPREVLLNLVSSTGSPNILANTLTEVLESIPGQTRTSGQSIVMDFIMTMGRHIILMDISSCLNLTSARYLNMLPSLRRFITENFNMDSFSEEAANLAAERINTEIKSFFQSLEGVTVREDIDLSASMCLISNHYIPLLIRGALEGYERRRTVCYIFGTMTDFVRSMVNVVMYASRTSQPQDVILPLARRFVQSTPALAQNWLCSEVGNLLGRICQGLDGQLNIAQMGFIVSTAPSRAANTNAQQQPMETDCEEIRPLPTLRQRDEFITDVVIGSEQWHQAVPPDWVPIITRDKREQRRAAAQGPLSDTYLSGMPSKRRKVVTDRKPHGTLTKVISESMTVALGAAGIVGSGMDGVAENAASDSSLRSAFKEQVRTTVESTLKNHPDYHPDKYPNAAKYFSRIHRQ